MFRKVTITLLVMAAAALLALSAAAQSAPTGGAPWDMRTLPQDGVFVFYDAPAQSSQTGKPVEAGDFNADGCGDLVITGHNASHSVNGTWRRGVGHVRFLLGLCAVQPGYVAMEADDPFSAAPADYALFTVYGEDDSDMLGTETTVADFNGDGYDDLLVSAQNHDGPAFSRTNAGAVYLIFGAEDFADHADIDLRDPGPDVLVIYGADAGDRFGLWVEHGDFDGDGFTDLLVGANQSDGPDNARANAGEAWIIYGAEDMGATYGAALDMRQPPADATRFIGANFDDLFGSTVVGGDLNGDGIDDAVISAALWRGSSGLGGLSFGGGDGPANDRYNAGESFVFYGGADLRGKTLDLALLLDDEGRPLDDSLTAYYGPGPNDLLGEEIAIGDLNGDGLNDLVMGSLVGYGPDDVLEESGEAWVIYTTRFTPGRMYDLANAPRSSVVIYPDQPFSKGGDTMRVNDIDGDGIDDLLYAAPDYDPTGYDLAMRRNAGLLAVLYGTPDGLPAVGREIRLPSVVPDDLRVDYVVGADPNDMLAYSMTVYDLDGDGWLDIIPNGMGGDGLTNTATNAGEIYVIDGAEFNNPDHVHPALSPEVTAPEATPTTANAFDDLPPLTVDTAEPGDVGEGLLLYLRACGGCHGPAADGAGVGPALVGNPFITERTAEDLLHFLRRGRSSDDPANESGINMPAYGGQADWGDAEVWHVVAYLRALNDLE